MDDAKAKDIKNVFVTFHNPVFNVSSFNPIPADQNPHATFASYADDFEELIVFNGHIHTTETYDVDGMKYFVLGSGGERYRPGAELAFRRRTPELVLLSQLIVGQHVVGR